MTGMVTERTKPKEIVTKATEIATEMTKTIETARKAAEMIKKIETATGTGIKIVIKTAIEVTEAIKKTRKDLEKRTDPGLDTGPRQKRKTEGNQVTKGVIGRDPDMTAMMLNQSMTAHNMKP